MKVELNDKRIKCKLTEISKGQCFLSPKNEICIKTTEVKYNPRFCDCGVPYIAYCVCVNIMTGDLLKIPPLEDVIPLNLKAVED